MKIPDDIKNDYEANQILLFLHAPIFTPKVWNKANDKMVEIDVARTKHERIVYYGHELDVKHDFQIFSFLVSRTQKYRNFLLQFSEREILNFLGIKANEKKVIEPLMLRFRRLMKCNFEIYRYEYDNMNQRHTVRVLSSNLVQKVDWDRERKIIEVKMDCTFGNIAASEFVKYKIYINNFRKIVGPSSNYARCLYLYLKSRDFKKHNKADLLARIVGNVKCKKNQNRFLKQALQTLKTCGLIKDFDYNKKSSIQQIDQVLIIK